MRYRECTIQPEIPSVCIVQPHLPMPSYCLRDTTTQPGWDGSPGKYPSCCLMESAYRAPEINHSFIFLFSIPLLRVFSGAFWNLVCWGKEKFLYSCFGAKDTSGCPELRKMCDFPSTVFSQYSPFTYSSYWMDSCR